jgi:AcrR family transcriptional regulator
VEESSGLRERKKAATRLALHEAALRLAVRDGLERVTVEAIADAANVSRRTFSNYFSGKEEAIYHGDAMRLRRILELVREQPAGEHPWAVLSRAAEAFIVELRTEANMAWLAQRRKLRRHPGLVAQQIAAYGEIERDLATALAERIGGGDVELRARLLGSTFLTTVRVAIQHWHEHPETPMLDVVRLAMAEATPVSAMAASA